MICSVEFYTDGLTCKSYMVAGSDLNSCSISVDFVVKEVYYLSKQSVILT